ncbi:MAG: GAF domain-containing protein, partial [Candidatus Rokubacteria bacterium]|nr:GAF domain-containing protein [Candidatus Rokubacteria bacterium]
MVRIGIALVGAGRGGAALLAALRDEPGVSIEVVVDTNPDAPGLALARQLGLPVLHDLREIVRFPIDLILEVTGRPEVLEALRAVAPAGVEVIGARAARVLWDLVERRRLQEGRLATLLSITHALNRERSPEVLFERIVREASALAGDAVAKLWLLEPGGGLTLVAAAGAQDVGLKAARSDEGLQGMVLRERRPLAVVDVRADPRALGPAWLEREGIASYAGVPLLVGED